MPPDRPWSLADDDVYALVAYLLAENGIVPREGPLDAERLKSVAMPSRDRFFTDDRRGGPVVK
jgi:cytochrome c